MKNYVCKIDVFHKEMEFCLFQVHQKVEPKLRVSQKNGSTETQQEETQEDCDLVLTEAWGNRGISGPRWAGSRKAGLWATLNLLGKHRSGQRFNVLPDRISLEEVSF